MTVVTVGIEAWSRTHAWNSQLMHSRAATENIAQAAAAHAEATLGTIRGLLDGMVERVETDGVDGPAGQRLHRYLVSRLPHHPALSGLFVYDRHGDSVVTSRTGTYRPLNYADRAYFHHHRAHRDDRSLLGRPVISKSSGEWVITMSRRLEDPQGNFAGVALATIPVHYFQRYYQRFSIGDKGAVLLAFDDATIVTRLPNDESVIGTNARHSAIFQHMDANPAEAGTVMLITNFDRIERQHSFRRVPGSPLIVVAALSKEEMFSDWWAASLQEGVVLLGMLMVLYAIGFWLIEQIRQRDRLEDALLQTQRALQERNAQLDHQARTDALTDLHNRRAFDEALEMELTRAQRSSSQLALVLLDVDFFKRYNDEYGHASGDDCLKMIGAVLREHVRHPGEIAARLGGEEFAILLPDTDADGALIVAESARKAVEERALEHRGNRANVVTISAGVATVSHSGHERARVLFETADMALYRAKAAGRNCVSSATAALDLHSVQHQALP